MGNENSVEGEKTKSSFTNNNECRCDTCNGCGYIEEWHQEDCPHCAGIGRDKNSRLMAMPCKYCDGSGTINRSRKLCPRCRGSGKFC